MTGPEQHDYFPLTEAGRHVPTGFARPHLKTWVRWALKGVGHRRVKLETWKFGGRRYTCRAAIQKFLVALNAHDGRSSPSPDGPTKAHIQAEHELLAEGM